LGLAFCRARELALNRISSATQHLTLNHPSISINQHTHRFPFVAFFRPFYMLYLDYGDYSSLWGQIAEYNPGESLTESTVW
jgi:hypothetical protein